MRDPELTRYAMTVPADDRYLACLRDRFGLQAFRRHQREVIEHVTEGRNALLVMPTGGGKSLCYQLPGILRGPTLVVSPLIALMEDQHHKLTQAGLRCDRIHSGRARGDSQYALRRWLDGELDYLLVAPERLRIAGFVPRLMRRPPKLVAIDEAHCISLWGHDFRPDYRLLGDRLPELRAHGDCPVVALTATATVRVQQDIVDQLKLGECKRFIRGFARENLALEIVEANPGERPELALQTLRDSARRPAIVYCLSRQTVEDVARAWQKEFKVAHYHAGMEADERARVQDLFTRGQAEVVVATVAFGMGIDKADIRTVVHLGMPGSVESYYQEVGRAGRDGMPSLGLALFSYADLKLHQNFFERAYPLLRNLAHVHAEVPAAGVTREELLRGSPLGLEMAEACVAKLWGLGAVVVDGEDVLKPGPATDWQVEYARQRAHREGQCDTLFDLARAPGCRMEALVSYFGDHTHNGRCGLCDRCNPGAARLRSLRAASPLERRQMLKIAEVLPATRLVSLGKIHRDEFAMALDRKLFDRLIDAMERAGIVDTSFESFDKDGQTIRYRSGRLALPMGRLPLDWVDAVQVEEERTPVKAAKPAAKAKSKAKAALTAEPVNPALLGELKAWRKARAQMEGVPAFLVLSDAVLTELARSRPTTREKLAAVHGIGPKNLAKYGAELLAELSKG